uniref:Capsid protein n=1 Tax=Phytophthora palustris toti-like virus 2-2 TaxID=2976310 RepID=A0A9E8YYG8_9VIRU|nr:capsid protein [Phytophthora palustris toti-like virus 2-2]
MLTAMSAATSFSEPTRVPSTEAYSPPLAGAVLVPEVACPLANGKFRQYFSRLTSETKLRGRYDVANRKIVYEVGARHHGVKSWENQAPVRAKDRPVIRQNVPTHALVKTELTDKHRRYTNFTGRFDYTDLSGMGQALGRALAIYSLTGELTWSTVSCGASLSIRALNVRTDPVSACEGSVYIPRLAAVDAAPTAFAALVAAANATGSTVVTDDVNIDDLGRTWIDSLSGAFLAKGVVYGMRVLLSMYHDMGFGPVMAYAIVSGVHSILSVVGHSDEGGVTRDAFRAVGFNASSGGVYVNQMRGYVGLPDPDDTKLESFQSLADSIALCSAALVSVSDPTVEIEGRVYPTIFSGPDFEGHDDASKARYARESAIYLANSVASEAYEFAAIYVPLLGRLFGVSGESDVAVTHLCGGFSEIARQLAESKPSAKPTETARHLRGPVIAPWFWIEPTSLLGEQFSDTAACKAGFGLLTYRDVRKTYPMFEWAQNAGEGGRYQDVVHSWRSARTNAGIIHLGLHPKDGLGYITPRQCVTSSFVMTGGSSEARTKLLDSEPLSSYLWGRGQSPIPAPAEAVYTGRGIGSTFMTHDVCDYDRLRDEATRSPDLYDIQNSVVTFTVGRVECQGLAGIMAFDRAMIRKRTQGAIALKRAREASVGCWTSTATRLQIADQEPAILSTPQDTEVPEIKAADRLFVAEVPKTRETTLSGPVPRVRLDAPERRTPAQRGAVPPVPEREAARAPVPEQLAAAAITAERIVEQTAPSHEISEPMAVSDAEPAPPAQQ